MMAGIIIMTAVIVLFHGGAYGYQEADEKQKADSLYSKPESPAVSMEERFEKAELVPAESQESRFVLAPNYPNPF